MPWWMGGWVEGPGGRLLPCSAGDLEDLAGKRSADLPDGAPSVVIHRDDLVMLP